MAIYMKYEGITGSVTQEDHKDWIELQSCQWGLSRNVQTTVGAAGEREAGHPHFSDISVTKEQDNSTGKLMKECVQQTQGKAVTIEFTSTDNQPVMKIEMEKVIITSQSGGGHGGPSHGPTVESYSLNFNKIIFTPTVRNPDGTQGKSPDRVGYDLSKAKPF
jgi:type VI secretion system secreted protein Hcp